MFDLLLFAAQCGMLFCAASGGGVFAVVMVRRDERLRQSQLDAGGRVLRVVEPPADQGKLQGWAGSEFGT